MQSESSEERWRVVTHDGSSNLKPRQSIAEGEMARPQQNLVSKRISKHTRARVLERDRYTCQLCGAALGDDDDQNPGRPVRLQIGHVVDRLHGGTDEPSNLRTLCSACKQGAKGILQEPPSWSWLLGQIRKAPDADQRKALDWLNKKFKG